MTPNPELHDPEFARTSAKVVGAIFIGGGPLLALALMWWLG